MAKRMTNAAVDEFFQRLSDREPEPKGELNYVNPYTLLVAVVLSAQATDIGVNKATGPLFKVADTPEKMVALGLERVRDYIKTIGLFNSKAKNVIALSEILIREHGSIVPQDRDELEKLPGVGRKTANVVLNMAFGQPTIAPFPRCQPHGHGRGQNPACGGTRPGKADTREMDAACASLADPARTLYLQGTQAGLPGMSGFGSVQFQGKDAGACLIWLSFVPRARCPAATD